MIQHEEARKFFESKKRAELTEADLNGFSEAYRELGKMIVQFPKKKNAHLYHPIQPCLNNILAKT